MTVTRTHRDADAPVRPRDRSVAGVLLLVAGSATVPRPGLAEAR